ncbi:MAG TPA: hypothetical protein VKA57_17110 [Solirubrobacteraceae bacterium]|nr:hypothetical protein [Solirubrobacteraceae bacterium]
MRRPSVLLVVAAIAAAPGCGEDPEERLALRTPQERSSAEPLAEVARAGGQADHAARARPARSVAERLRPVLRGWGEALRRDRNRRAARYFALPTIVAQGDVLTLTTAAQVRMFNKRLPCGARLLHVQQDGRFLVGTFELTRRPEHECSARGELLRVAFALRRRKIAEWRELPQATGPGSAGSENAPEDSA